MSTVKVPQTQRLVVVSGLSGGGKSTALRALEDLGYYCVDNLPAALLPEFAHQALDNPALYSRVSLGIDARSGGPDLERIPAWLDEMTRSGLSNQLLFLTADARAIIKRFSETRRRHPLTRDRHPLAAAIDQEKALLATLQQRAEWVIDTSDINIHQLRRQVWKCVGNDAQSMTIVLESFAYKRGVPQDVDFMFDVRHLPNPHWSEELRHMSGLDQPVQQWLEQDESVNRMFRELLELLQNWLPEIQQSQRSYVTIGIGCTGGRHRSVYLAARLAESLGQRFSPVLVHHRELQS